MILITDNDNGFIIPRRLSMKKYLPIMILTIFLLTSCSALMPEPTPTPTLTPLPTSTPVPTATPEPTPTPDPLIFEDLFEGAIDPEWQLVNENEDRWSLEANPGWLEIIAARGNVAGGSMENVLLRTIPEGNFELETKMSFRPIANFQFAGLLIYESAANSVQFGRAFCSPSAACVGDGFYMDLFIGGGYGGENFSTSAPDADIVYLRLRREGNTYTAYFSEDGSDWNLEGAHTSDMNAQFVGLVAGQSTSGTVPAQFDYFTINTLP
jgi:beta-xylosidase